MKESQFNRRKFIRNTVTTAAGLVALSALPPESLGATTPVINRPEEGIRPVGLARNAAARIRFSVIGINHGHINSQVEAVVRGGGEFVSFYAKEADLASAFAKRHPQAKQARNEQEILDDKSVQLVLSAAIPDERAPLGIRVMRHGKDYMVDKPGITTLLQLAEVRRVQKETRRIYSIMYSERLENRATIKAGELVKAGAIGQVIQTIGLGPHRMNPKRVPSGSSTASVSGV
jgi:predicted dehydrogenase